MKSKSLFTLLLAISASALFAQTPNKYVNPMIGTRNMGHTFPGACAPFGIVQLSPDTDTVPHNIDGKYVKDVYKYCAGYQYDDLTIVGFSHTHFSGTGHSDLGDILIMPTTGEIKLNPGVESDPNSGYRSRFSHSTEKAQPGYYEVMLDDYGVKAQLTATERVGVHKYTFEEGDNQQIILDLIHGIYNYDGKVLWANLRVENERLLTGYRITNGWARTNYTYFAIEFSKPIVDFGYEDKEEAKYKGFWRKFDNVKRFPEMGGRKIVSYFCFESDDKPLEIKVALSGVSTNGAVANLNAETKGKDFDAIHKEAIVKWSKELNVIEAQGENSQLNMLYTSLYHTMINPSIYMDVDGNYRGIDHQIHKAEDFTNYTVFSVWDTYRAQHPLLNILKPERNKDMVRSMLAHQSQSVHKALPVWSHMGNENWCMIGYHSVSVVGDALVRDLVDDKKAALDAMDKSANVLYYDNIGDYIDYGYVPMDKNGNGASITLEYAYDDWVIYNAALNCGDSTLAEKYKKRAQNYRNIFDPRSNFAMGRYSNGKFKDNPDLLNTHGEGFIEGNAWNYSFYVPHDVSGLIELMGGDRVFISRLDSLFTMHLPDEFFAHTEDVTREGLLGNYVHGNEPSHHIPYLYMWSSQPWKTQYWVREIMNNMYKDNIDGLCGNDDCGQMSAWYIFTAMGFYPVCPGTDQYVLGAPYLPYMKIDVGNGKFLEIKAPKVSDKNRYVHSVKLNGEPYKKGYITYDDIISGGELLFEMGSKPNKRRKFEGENRPYSM